MWDLPGPGLEPVSAALAGGFFTTAPPGKSSTSFWFVLFLLGCAHPGLQVGCVQLKQTDTVTDTKGHREVKPQGSSEISSGFSISVSLSLLW